MRQIILCSSARWDSLVLGAIGFSPAQRCAWRQLRLAPTVVSRADRHHQGQPDRAHPLAMRRSRFASGSSSPPMRRPEASSLGR